MKQFCPLPTTHPEFTVLQSPGLSEYRVESWYLARDGSGKIKDPASPTWWDIAILLFSFSWFMFKFDTVSSILACLTVLCLGFRWVRVIFESVLIIPPHGIQFVSDWGLFSYHLFATRRFIPSHNIEDVVIHEALRRWNIYFYMGAIKRIPTGGHAVEVAYPNVLPPDSVLTHVFNAIHESLLHKGYHRQHPAT